jgi:hypothetical protein
VQKSSFSISDQIVGNFNLLLVWSFVLVSFGIVWCGRLCYHLVWWLVASSYDIWYQLVFCINLYNLVWFGVIWYNFASSGMTFGIIWYDFCTMGWAIKWPAVCSIHRLDVYEFNILNYFGSLGWLNRRSLETENTI